MNNVKAREYIKNIKKHNTYVAKRLGWIGYGFVKNQDSNSYNHVQNALDHLYDTRDGSGIVEYAFNSSHLITAIEAIRLLRINLRFRYNATEDIEIHNIKTVYNDIFDKWFVITPNKNYIDIIPAEYQQVLDVETKIMCLSHKFALSDIKFDKHQVKLQQKREYAKAVKTFGLTKEQAKKANHVKIPF